MVDHILVGGLKMNFNYSCVVIDAGTADVVTKAVLFKTNHGGNINSICMHVLSEVIVTKACKCAVLWGKCIIA